MIKWNYLFILGLLFFSTLQSCEKEKTIILHDDHTEVIMRKIGHEILLLSDDSTSVVRPIVYENEKYRIQFDASFSFLPEDLVKTIDTIIKVSYPQTNYLVQVETCDSNLIIYSYETDVFSSVPFPGAVACKLREQPAACYEIVIQFIEEEKTANTYLYVLLLIIIISIIAFVYFRKKRPVNDGGIKIGSYLYNPNKMTLTLINKTIELTSKESELLSLLYASANETVARETLLNKIWGDEGDYVGRTLDVYISKLRKKLESDASIEIKNIRGIGYKLII